MLELGDTLLMETHDILQRLLVAFDASPMKRGPLPLCLTGRLTVTRATGAAVTQRRADRAGRRRTSIVLAGSPCRPGTVLLRSHCFHQQWASLCWPRASGHLQAPTFTMVSWAKQYIPSVRRGPHLFSCKSLQGSSVSRPIPDLEPSACTCPYLPFGPPLPSLPQGPVETS